MTFDWRFTTEGTIINPEMGGEICHTGPMTDLEIALSTPYHVFVQSERLRASTLRHIVDHPGVGARTREILLRTLHSPLAPVFPPLYNAQSSLEAHICGKRRSTDIDKDLKYLYDAARQLCTTLSEKGVAPTNIRLLLDSIDSNNAQQRVAGICSALIFAAYIELETK